MVKNVGDVVNQELMTGSVHRAHKLEEEGKGLHHLHPKIMEDRSVEHIFAHFGNERILGVVRVLQLYPAKEFPNYLNSKGRNPSGNVTNSGLYCIPSNSKISKLSSLMDIESLHPALRRRFPFQRKIHKLCTNPGNQGNVVFEFSGRELRAKVGVEDGPLFSILQLNVLINDWRPEGLIPLAKVVSVSEEDPVDYVGIVDVQDWSSALVHLSGMRKGRRLDQKNAYLCKFPFKAYPIYWPEFLVPPHILPVRVEVDVIMVAAKKPVRLYHLEPQFLQAPKIPSGVRHQKCHQEQEDGHNYLQDHLCPKTTETSLKINGFKLMADSDIIKHIA